MQTTDLDHQNSRTIDRIQSMFGVHDHLSQYAAAVQVSIENTVIVLRGELPIRRVYTKP